MLGAIIGDIVGSRFEFNNTKDFNFELFTNECSFTDDTICTIAIANALTDGDRDYQGWLRCWCKLFNHPMGGYGGSYARWIASDDPQPYNSFGNGSAMRVSPVAWWFDTLEEVKQIQNEGRARREQAEIELGQIEGELKQKLLEMRG